MAFAIDKNKIAKNTIALYIRMGFTMVISFLTARVTLQVLGVEDYGLNNLVGSIVALFSFINGSIGTAVQRFYSIEIGKKDFEGLCKVFGVGKYLHRIVAFITFVIAEIFAVFFLSKLNIPQERMFAAHVVFQISVVSFALNILNVPYAALLRAREQFSKVAVYEIIQSLLRLAVLYLLCIINYDKIIVLSLLNFGVTIFFITSIYFLARHYKESHTHALWDKEIINKMLNFVYMLILTVMASLGRDQGVIILINIFFGLTINAAYAIAMQIMHIVNTFVMNFKQSVVPQIMLAYGANDVHAMTKLINVGTKLTFLLLLMISLPVYFEIDVLLELWLKTPPEHTAELVKLVIININVSSFTYFLYQGVHATGNITKQQTWMSLTYLLNVFFIFIGFNLGFDFTSALYITIVASFIQCMINVYFAAKNFRYKVVDFIKDVLSRSLIMTSLCIPLVSFFTLIENPILEFLCISSFSIIGIFLLGYIIMLNSSEKEYICNIIKVKLK